MPRLRFRGFAGGGNGRISFFSSSSASSWWGGAGLRQWCLRMRRLQFYGFVGGNGWIFSGRGGAGSRDWLRRAKVLRYARCECHPVLPDRMADQEGAANKQNSARDQKHQPGGTHSRGDVSLDRKCLGRLSGVVTLVDDLLSQVHPLIIGQLCGQRNSAEQYRNEPFMARFEGFTDFIGHEIGGLALAAPTENKDRGILQCNIYFVFPSFSGLDGTDVQKYGIAGSGAQ